MRSKMNSYGKTWHTWNTSHGGVAGDPLLGQPVLAWSFSRFGEADPALVAGRDQRMGIDQAAGVAAASGPCAARPSASGSRRPGRAPSAAPPSLFRASSIKAARARELRPQALCLAGTMPAI